MAESLLIKQGEIYDAVQDSPYMADILIENGKIVKIAPVIEGKAVNEARILDVSGWRVYPGFVDAHCHLGMDGHGGGFENQDFNELNDPVTPNLSAVDGINPLDRTFQLVREAGVTCVASGPGSSNVVGGTFCVLKTVGNRVDDMVIKPKAAMKIAFGENPKTCYQKKEITSRMSIAAKLREVLEKTLEYDKRRESDPEHTPYDAKLEAMLPVVRGEMPLKAHVHRADDMFTAIRIAREFHLGLTMDHCTDGALIAGELAKEGYSLAVGPSFGHATKRELVNKSFHTPGVLANAGCKVSIITDSPVVEGRYLTLCAGLAIREGMTEQQALRAITINSAEHIGAGDRVGSIEEGKDADFVVTLGSPFGADPGIVYTIIDGNIVYENHKHSDAKGKVQ
ncbi:MAG: amidohydrolase [Lachnospiraceae bacterium]|nr:amidohydrolase [Lachnospiraceae bacterium]